MLIHQETLMSGVWFRHILRAELTSETFTISIMVLGIKITDTPLANLRDVQIKRGIISNEIMIVYFGKNKSLKTVYLYTSEPLVWKRAFENIGMQVKLLGSALI